jgi:hypothetical protein
MIDGLMTTNIKDQSMKEFAEYLKKSGNPQVVAIIKDWQEFRESKAKVAKLINVDHYENAESMHDFLSKLKDAHFTEEKIRELVLILENENITDMETLSQLTDEDLQSLHIKFGDRIRIKKVLDLFKAEQVKH